jgi:predicted DNA-binding transcriptional regulator AlpA
MAYQDQYLRFSDLQQRGIVSNRQTLGRWIQNRHFPRGVMMGPGVRAWSVSVVQEWLDNRPAAVDPAKADEAA